MKPLAYRLSRAWEEWWFDEIPPHIYSLLRILLGALACVTLIGIHDLPTFWDLGGFVSAQDRGLGLKAYLLAHGLGTLGGRLLFFSSFGVFAAMTVGFKTQLTVPLGLVASLMDISWNYLPHSGAYAAIQTMLFCLIWADCGAVWSLDAWLESRGGRARHIPTFPIAPLRLIRLQVGLIYFSTGLRKLYSETWRDGSAIHYVMYNNIFQRFPHALPVALEPLATMLTYIVLVWEVGFLFALLYAPTRRLVLILGILLHLGMQSTMEIGPFAWVMLASYAAFIEPAKVPLLPGILRRSVSSTWVRLTRRSVNDAVSVPDVAAATAPVQGHPRLSADSARRFTPAADPRP